MDRVKALLPLSDRNLFWCFGALFLVCLGYAILHKTFLPLAVPFSVPLVLVLLTNYRILYYLLIFSLPFSMEFAVGSSLTSDLPSEPLMILLMGCFIGSLLGGTRPDPRFFKHPLVILISLMYLWAVVSTLFSVDTTKSVKYLLAKAWYIVPFLLLTGAIIKDLKVIRRILWFFLVPASALVALVLLRHMRLHFAFDMVQQAITPFYKNHVIYATSIALFLPFVITLFFLEKRPVIKFFLIGIFGLLLTGVIFSYTRASWLSLPIAGFYFLAIRFRLTKPAIIVAYAGAIFAAGYLINENRFMLYAPDYEKTVFNGENLEKHLEATYKMADVSGMERVYRWVAVFYMASEKPIAGSGPSTFYPEYQKYTVKSFRTYVSNNPERSTTHNYFLLQLAEQGFVGMFLFMIFVAAVLVLPQTLYHRTRNPELRAVIVGAGLCLVIIIFHLTLNELLEVEKVGSFYFISIALLIKLDIWTREEEQGLLEAAGK